jgi:hypothetical protein
VEWYHYYIILGVVIAVIVAAYIIIRKRINKRVDDQKSLVDQHKVTTSILVLEKRMDKVTNTDLPKNVLEQIPKIYRVRKVPIVKAKIGPQVMDLMCDDKVFDKLPEKKSVKVDIAGIYIAGIKTGKK